MFNVIDIIVILIILISVFLGYKKGFVRTAVSLLSFFVAIGVALLFYKPLAIILTENTTIDDWIIMNITSNHDDNENLTESSETDESGDVPMFIEEASNLTEEKETNNLGLVIGMLENLPATITDKLSLEEIKSDTKQEIAYKVSELIMNLLSLIIIYIVVKVTLIIAAFILDGIMKFPILKQLNEILGMGIGAVIGFIQIYVAFAVITFISSICDISVVIETIKLSAFAKILFENNVIISLLF